MLFPIIQGGMYPELRQQSVATVVSKYPEAKGYALGGFSVGETTTERKNIVAYTAARLPTTKARYLMGVGNTMGCTKRY